MNVKSPSLMFLGVAMVLMVNEESTIISSISTRNIGFPLFSLDMLDFHYSNYE